MLLTQNIIYRKLREMGIKLGSKVGIFMERSEDIVIAMLAVMKSSGIYIPLDIELPGDRFLEPHRFFY